MTGLSKSEQTICLGCGGRRSRFMSLSSQLAGIDSEARIMVAKWLFSVKKWLLSQRLVRIVGMRVERLHIVVINRFAPVASVGSIQVMKVVLDEELFKDVVNTTRAALDLINDTRSEWSELVNDQVKLIGVMAKDTWFSANMKAIFSDFSRVARTDPVVMGALLLWGAGYFSEYSGLALDDSGARRKAYRIRREYLEAVGADKAIIDYYDHDEEADPYIG